VTDERFDRQVRFAPLGLAGQERLARSRVLLVGCGALGGALAQTLVRCGVGTLRIVDRDLVDVSNLARQVLFEPQHATLSTPKVDAAREVLARIGSPTVLETDAVHLDAEDVLERIAGCDLVLDGSDNLATRYVVNDACVQAGIPWIYGGVVGAHGLVLPVLPGSGPCLRCVFPEPPPPATLETCQTAGVIAPAVAAIAALQAGFALRLLANPEGFVPALFELDVWDGSARRLELSRSKSCPCCGAREFPFLSGGSMQAAMALCGRHAVQVQPGGTRPDLAALERSLAAAGAGSIERRGSILRFQADEQRFTVFADGRTLIEGVDDEGRALALYDRWIGR
jgi:molybdopterin/thiamine biosynthesis adenylyltransferase